MHGVTPIGPRGLHGPTAGELSGETGASRLADAVTFLLQRGDLSQAIRLLRNPALSHRRALDSLRRAGYGLFKQSRFHEGFRLLDAAIEVGFGTSETFGWLGLFARFAGLAGGDAATEPDDPAVHQTQDILSSALSRRLDLFVNKTDWVTWLADGNGWIGTGAFAQWYLDEGGPVHYMGKPYPAYYDAIRRFVDLDNSRVLIIGDHLLTDIAGGLNQGFDTLFVDTLPKGEVIAAEGLIKALGLSYVLPDISPNYVIDALR